MSDLQICLPLCPSECCEEIEIHILLGICHILLTVDFSEFFLQILRKIATVPPVSFALRRRHLKAMNKEMVAVDVRLFVILSIPVSCCGQCCKCHRCRRLSRAVRNGFYR